MDYGIWTLLPIVVVVAVALKSKRALEPLILGTLLTYIIVDGLSFPIGWMDAFFRVATDQSHQWVFMVCGLFGALIALLGASHGTLGFSRLLGRLCRGPRTTLIVTWVMGILIFVDDYLNIMTLSTCMRKLTDRQKVPRETLSYIIDSTGAPVESMMYAIAAVALVPLFSLGLVPKLGRMKKAYRRVEETGKVYSPESAELNLEDEDDSPAITGCLWDFVLPIGTLIALTIVGGELFLALVAAIAVCFLLYIPRKKLSLTRFCDLAMHGFCNMIPTVAIIFFAFVMQEGMTEIGIAPFVINAVKPILSPAVFPAIAFLVVAALNFTTGSVWGITAVTVPILLPLAFSIGANPLLVMGAIVSGATLGSHACFYSDATVLTSSCCKMENMDHALSQLPYSLCAAGLSAAGYLVCGLLM